MRKTIIKATLALTCGVFMFSAQAGDWVLEKDDTKLGIKVYTRVVEGSALKEFKGVATVPASLVSTVALVDDHPAGSSWIHDCKELETVERPSPTETIFYLVTAAPWPVKDRDSTVYTKLTQDPESLAVRITMDIRQDVRPEVKGRVRLKEMKGFWEFTPVDQHRTEVTYQVHADPAGSLPDWLVNSLVVDMPYNTLKNMQTKVLEDKYQQATLETVKNF